MALSLCALTPAAPAWAHRGEAHQAPASAASSHAVANQAPDVEMSGAEMAWPANVDEDGAAAAHQERPKSFLGRLVAWLGVWHPAAVHFPIALLLTVAFLEAAAALRRKPHYNAGNDVLLGLATLSACIAAPLGWVSAGLPKADEEWFLTAHRWLGTALPFLILLLWRLRARPGEPSAKTRLPFYKAALIVAVLAVLAQAYLGAAVTHGLDHLGF